MKKKNPENDIQQEQYLKNWCIVVSDFLQSISKHTLFLEWSSEIALDTDCNPKAWRLAYETLLSVVLELEPPHYKQLNAILKEKFGSDLNDLNSKQQKKIETIVRRNKIRNEEEYYLLRDYCEKIWDEEQYITQTEVVQKVLFSYEQKQVTN